MNKTMECPIDGTTLETRRIHTIDVEECVRCQGLWFEAGELRRAKDESATDLKWLDFDLWSDPEPFSTDWSSRRCPECDRSMATISYGATGVAVDYCVSGHGVWLDKGEFQAIIEALETEAGSKTVSGYLTASLEEAKELLTGEEGFLSDWKDLLSVVRLLEYRFLVENPRLAELLAALQVSSP